MSNNSTNVVQVVSQPEKIFFSPHEPNPHIQPKIHQSQYRGGDRYFFNGQEGDNEVFGELANFGYEFRQYDSGLGRWWSVDPKWNEYPSVSPYVFCNGSQIVLMDIKGSEAWKPDGKGGWIAQRGEKQAARLWKPGSFKSSQKWANQFINRGWAKEQVMETIKTGKKYQQINM